MYMVLLILSSVCSFNVLCYVLIGFIVCSFCILCFFFFFFKQKTAYEMRISDWSSDVCSSDLDEVIQADRDAAADLYLDLRGEPLRDHERMRGSDMVKGLYDDSEEIQAFRNHRLQSTAELRAKLGRVSAGAYASRSEERRVGKECVSTCRSRWAPYHEKKKNHRICKLYHTTRHIEDNTLNQQIY